METKGIPKKDGTGNGERANKGRGGCDEPESEGKGRPEDKEDEK